MIWIAILFAIATLPWVFPVLWQARPAQAVAGILLLGTVAGPAFFAIDGPIQLSLERILWVGFMGVLALRLLRGSERMDSVDRFDVLLLAFVGWTMLSCVRFGLTNAPQPPITRWFFYLFMPCTLYFAMRVRQLNDEQSLEKLVRSLTTASIVLSTYLGLTGVFETLDLRMLVFPKFINDPEVWEFYGRARGPLLNPAGNGILMTIGLAACVSRFLPASRYGKVLYAGLALIAVMGCYCTLTRSVWMGVAMTMGLIGLLYAPMKIRIMALFGGVLLAGVMTTGLKDRLLEIKRDKNLSAAESAKSVELRPLLAVVAWEMVKDRPLGGHGYGQYLKAAEPYHTIRSHGLPLEIVRPYIQHNVLLGTVVDLGLIGLALQLLILGSLACIAWQMCCRNPAGSPQRNWGMIMIGVLSSYFCNGMFHDVSIISMVNMYLLSFAGLTITVARSSWEPHRVPLARGRRVSDRAATDASLGGADPGAAV